MFLSKIILFVSSLLVLNGSFNATPDPVSCLLYKKGKFERSNRHCNGFVNFGTLTMYIDRNDTMELVRSELFDDTSYYRIKWLSDCSYERAFLRNSIGIKKQPVIDTVTILSTAGKYYFEKNGKTTNTVWVKELHITLSEED